MAARALPKHFPTPLFVHFATTALSLAAVLLPCSSAAAQSSAGSATLATFAAGAFPVSSLVQAPDLNLYGVTEQGGADQLGSIVRFTPAGVATTVYSFTGSESDGSLPVAGLTIGLDGALYGTTLTGGAKSFGTVFRITLGGTFSLVHSFDPDVDGNSPNAALCLGSDGTLYGTLAEGAYDSSTQAYADGAIFAVSTAGSYSMLYQFPADGSLGSTPAARLLQASDGALWGAATDGGANGYGNIFRFSPASGSMADEYDLNAADGSVENGLTEIGGTLYGVTYPDALDSGEIFSMTLSGAFSVAYTFTGGTSDGGSPATSLFAGSDGALWGATQSGGAAGTGTLFRYVPGSAPVALYSFPAGSLNTMQDGALLQTPAAAFTFPAMFDSESGLSAAGMDGAGVLLSLAPAYATQPPSPVSLTLANSVPVPGSSDTLTWQAENAGSDTAQTCVAGGAWSGARSDNGTLDITVPAWPATYTLTCGGNLSNTITVTPATPAANVSLSLPASVQQGQPASLVAAVAASGTAPTGSIAFVADGFYTIGTAALGASGSATLTASTSGVPPGTYSIQAVYSGDSNYAATRSQAENVTVTPAQVSTTTALVVSPNPVAANSSGTLRATVTASDTSTPTGHVTFYADGIDIGSAALSAGAATLTRSVAGVPAATYSVDAVYSGDATHSASTSAAVTVTVQ